jgi:hypothetical protein
MWGAGVGAFPVPGGVAQTVREQVMAVNAKSNAAAKVRVSFMDFFCSGNCSAVYKRIPGMLLREIGRVDLTARLTTELVDFD